MQMRGLISRTAVAFSLAIIASSLAGCRFDPDVFSAQSHRTGDEEFVRVRLRSSDAETIKRRELYFSLVVFNCTGRADRYPAEAFIGGERASDFRFPTAGASVEVTGRVPAWIYAKYRKPCVFLEGGSYLSGTIKSMQLPIKTAPGELSTMQPAGHAR
jgi:hypothetical protein